MARETNEVTPSGSSAQTSLWAPLRARNFRNLLIANVVSDVGTFMQNVGAAWLMVSLNAGPMYVALTQTASALPFFLLALPAGAIGDIVDRRKLILCTEIWMATVAALLTALTLGGVTTPLLLLVLTFFLASGDAFESPTWRAVLPELVEKRDLAAASALNGIEFNFARAVGPALAGAVLAFAGVGTAFLINTLSFAGVIYVVARWKRSAVKHTTPPETIAGATQAAIRYIRYSPEILTLLARSGLVMFFASGLLALLPSIARRVGGGSLGYGLLLGAFGAGAVLGALVLQKLRSRFSTNVVISSGIALFGLAAIATGIFRTMWSLAPAMLVAGGAWVSFLSLFNVQLLNRAPDWVRARVLAGSLLVFQGAVAAGSAVWGAVAVRAGIRPALFCAGVGTLASAASALFLRVPDVGPDLTPWNHWRLPPFKTDLDHPVLVTVEYDVSPGRESEFLDAIREYGRVRRRDGASRWGICRDIEASNRYLETFVVSSWDEHVRQHDRLTRGDSELTRRLRSCIGQDPIARHLLYL
jgi:predicted MFS family arabinose efflux permease